MLALTAMGETRLLPDRVQLGLQRRDLPHLSRCLVATLSGSSSIAWGSIQENEPSRATPGIAQALSGAQPRSRALTTMRRPVASLFLTIILILPSPGCGTLMFSERQHQVRSDRFDPNVLVLDGIGLFFFVVPGLVAFAVDLYTGAIYLPEDVERGEGPFIRD